MGSSVHSSIKLKNQKCLACELFIQFEEAKVTLLQSKSNDVTNGLTSKILVIHLI